RRAKQLRRYAGEVRGRALDRPTRLQSSKHAEPPVRARGETALVVVVQQRLGADGNRDVEAPAHFEPVEGTRGDADDLDGMRREPDRLPQDRGAARVRALPERVAEYCARGTAGTIVRGSEQSSGGWTDAKDVEESAADPESVGRMACAVAGRRHVATVRQIE